MVQVASCPQCKQDLFVPEETTGEAWTKCPECRAYFQLKDAATRELPTAVLVQLDSGDAGFTASRPTIRISRSAEANDAAGAVPEPAAAPELKEDAPAVTSQSTDELEDAAERIDKWFRSAKTLADVPAATTDATATSGDTAEDGSLHEPGPTIEVGTNALDGVSPPDACRFS